MSGEGPGDLSGISTLDPASLCTSFRSTPRDVSARREPGTAGAELGVGRRDFTAVAWPPVRAAGVRDRLRIRSAGVEVLGLRMMDDQSVRRLFWMQLQLLRKDDADPLRAKQIDKLRPVFQIGTGGIAEGVAGASVGLVPDHVVDWAIVTSETEVRANPRVPHFRQGLGQLHAQPVQLQVVPIGVLFEQLRRRPTHRRPHGDQVEGDDVWTLSQGQVTIAEEVCEAQVSWPPLAREGEPRHFTARVVDVDTEFMDHDGVALAVTGPVTVDHRELGDRGRLDPVEPGTQAWSAFTFDQLVIGRAAARPL